jgi:hypothetical protein
MTAVKGKGGRRKVLPWKRRTLPASLHEAVLARLRDDWVYKASTPEEERHKTEARMKESNRFTSFTLARTCVLVVGDDLHYVRGDFNGQSLPSLGREQAAACPLPASVLDGR